MLQCFHENRANFSQVFAPDSENWILVDFLYHFHSEFSTKRSRNNRRDDAITSLSRLAETQLKTRASGSFSGIQSSRLNRAKIRIVKTRKIASFHPLPLYCRGFDQYDRQPRNEPHFSKSHSSSGEESLVRKLLLGMAHMIILNCIAALNGECRREFLAIRFSSFFLYSICSFLLFTLHVI